MRAETREGSLREEVLVVLSLSLLASVVYAIIDLFSAPLRGVARAVYPQVGLPLQLADIAFGLAPVWLVIHLVRRSDGGAAAIGLTRARPSRVILEGTLLALVVGAAGIGIYLGSVALGWNRFVVPVPPLGHWWTWPVVVLGAAQAALLEEVIGAGYLITRLRQFGWSRAATVSSSALLRGGYHLYQGWGGFLGNVALGAFFGWIFVKRGKLWPLIVAHFLLDVGAAAGYVLFRDRLPGP
ncbi:MAG: CPBP family intramembrane glutamic endopeptidase [Actinomycetota bacterium]